MELAYRPVYTESDSYATNQGIGILAIVFSSSIVIILLIIDLPTLRRDLAVLYENLLSRSHDDNNSSQKTKKMADINTITPQMK